MKNIKKVYQVQRELYSECVAGVASAFIPEMFDGS